MNTQCDNRIGERCKLSGDICPHLVYDGKCDRATCKAAGMPTFARMCAIYRDHSKSALRGVTYRVKAVERIVGIAGLRMTDSAAHMTEDAWELVLARMTAGTHPMAKEGGYDLATVNCYFAAFRAVCGRHSREIRSAYRAEGLTMYDADLIPPVEVPHKEIEELTKAQVRAVKDRMVMLRQPCADKRSAQARRDMFVWMWFAFYFGVRPADIGRLTWGCFKDDPDGGKRLEYVPCKTERKTGGRAAGCRIHPNLWQMIEPYIGATDEFVIPRDARKRANAPTHGEYVGSHTSLQRRVNSFMRSIGVSGHMAAYTLRRDCSRYTIEHDGALAEMQKLGHSPAVAFGHYTNAAKLRVGRTK